MKITRKLMENGVHIGYEIDDDGFIQNVLTRCLYTAAYMPMLIQAGYKYYDYDADNIEDAAGNKITSLPEIDIEMDEDEKFALEDLAATAMSDAECSKYYSFEKTSIISFREPVEVKIKTREELIEYLTAISKFVDEHGYSTDVRPLNSFVAKEALFTCDEVRSNENIHALLIAASKRHRLRNFATYDSLCKWLREQGVLNSATPTYEEFLNAYYAWGVDGLRDDCIKMELKQNVDGPFLIQNEQNSNNFLTNRDEKFVLWDSSYCAHYLNKDSDLSEIQSFDREPIVLGNEGALFKAKKSIDSWGAKCKVIKAYVSRTSSRLYFSFISDEGFPYHYRVSHNEWALFTSNRLIANSSNFSIQSIRRDMHFTLDKVSTQNEYYLWNLAISKAYDIVKSKNVPVPAMSTYDMLIQEGLTPKAAISMIVNDIYYNPRNCTSTDEYKDATGKRPNYAEAFKRYTGTVPANVLSKYNVEESSFDDMDEFIDMVSDVEVEQDFSKSTNSGKGVSITSGMNTISALSGEEVIDPAKFVDDVSFVKQCLNNEITINAMGDGIKSDLSAAVQDIADLIVTAARLKFRNEFTRNQISDFIVNFESYSPFDIDKTFRKRDATYKGWLKDVSYIRGKRAFTSWAWLYCTKVFREISNAPMSEQRHYAMEVVSVTNTKLRTALRDCVMAADMSSFAPEIKEFIEDESYYLAANLFFYILAGNVDASEPGPTIHFSIKVTDNDSLTVPIPRTLYDSICRYDILGNTQYITLYDYNKFEFGENGAFTFFLVNANVTPWRVTPKKGFAIKSFNFMLNYNAPAAFESFSDNFKNQLATCGGKCDVILSKLPGSSFIPDYTIIDEINNPDDYSLDNIDSITSEYGNESIHLYKRRWMLKSKAAKAEGMVLRTMQMKQDVLWSILAKYCNETTLTEDEIDVPSAELKSNNFLSTMEPDLITRIVNRNETPMIDSRVARRYIFVPTDFPTSEVCKWDALLSGNFVPSANICMNSNSFMLVNGTKTDIVPFSNLTKDSLEELAGAHACYQLDENKFLFICFNGNYVLEV